MHFASMVFNSSSWYQFSFTFRFYTNINAPMRFLLPAGWRKFAVSMQFHRAHERRRGPTGTFFSWIVNRSILIVGTYGADCEPAASEEVVVNFLSVLREGKKVWTE